MSYSYAGSNTDIENMVSIILTNEWKEGSLFWNMVQVKGSLNLVHGIEGYFLRSIISAWLADKLILFSRNFSTTTPCDKEFFQIMAQRYGGKPHFNSSKDTPMECQGVNTIQQRNALAERCRDLIAPILIQKDYLSLGEKLEILDIIKAVILNADMGLHNQNNQ